jgi:transcriptional regulator with XRE-family HTH domain
MQEVIAKWAEDVAEAMAARHPSMSMGDLARRCGVTTGTISRFISGDRYGMRRNPSDELKFKIAGVLHLRMDKLFAYPAVIPPVPDIDQAAA